MSRGVRLVRVLLWIEAGAAAVCTAVVIVDLIFGYASWAIALAVCLTAFVYGAVAAARRLARYRGPVALLALGLQLPVAAGGVAIAIAAHQRDSLQPCLTASVAAERKAASPLITDISQAPRPGVLKGMRVGQLGSADPIIGPWTTRLRSRTAANAIAAWLPRRYLTDVTTERYASGEWEIRGNDVLGQGVFIVVTAKPQTIGARTVVFGYIGTPAVPDC